MPFKLIEVNVGLHFRIYLQLCFIIIDYIVLQDMVAFRDFMYRKWSLYNIYYEGNYLRFKIKGICVANIILKLLLVLMGEIK